jgi:hypothetical protein
MSELSITPDTRIGTAFHLAACNLGLDCSPAKVMPCASEGTCPGPISPGDYPTMLRQMLGPSNYQQVSRMAADIVAAIEAGDTAKLYGYLQLREN